MNVIQTEKLCKSYGPHRVLHDVDFSVAEGKLVGFLGPNGAGKTTTIRILMGLLRVGSGAAKIFGVDCRSQGKQTRKQIGYLPGDVYFYQNMTGQKTLQFMARARKVDCSAEIKRLSNVFQLDLSKTVRKYSTGMRQKLGLIQALMHRPKLLILDEPTSGLDPLMRQAVFQELRQVIGDGRSVLFSSHSLDEVEELCDEVIILRTGRIVEHQSIDELKRRALRRIEIAFVKDIPQKFPQQFQLVKHGHSSVLGTWAGEITKLLDWVKQFEIEDLIIERPDLNDLFITYYFEDGDDRLPESGQ